MSNTENRTRAVELALEKDRAKEKPTAIKNLLSNAQKIEQYINDGSLPAAGSAPGSSDDE